MSSISEIEILHRELMALFQYIQRVREEVAAITQTTEEREQGHFNTMSDQLDAIVQATEHATNNIMEAVELNADIVMKIRDKVEDDEILGLLDEMENNTGKVYEACSFQDITGQRVSKVARSVTYVEARVNALIDIIGKEDVEKVEVEEEEQTEDEKLLSGPQLEGEGISQDEIDKLFD